MTDKMRKEFEMFYKEWSQNEGHSHQQIECDISSYYPNRDKYGYSDIQEFWVFWKASRTSLCVKLPEDKSLNYYDRYTVMENDGFNDCLNTVKSQLEASGVSYEPLP